MLRDLGLLGAGMCSVSEEPECKLVADEVLHPIGKIQPLLIGLNVPDQVECSRTGARLSGPVWTKAC